MTTLTHDEIAREAQQLWQDFGRPAGRDTEIWLKAEQNLHEKPAANSFTARASAEAASESEVENLLSPAETEQKSIQAAMQQVEARSPQVPRHTGPKSKPPQTGKPVWNRPHSS